MLSTLKKGVPIGTHTHSASSEIAYVLSGKARCVLDGIEEIVLPGQCHYCPQGSTHSIENASGEPLVLFDVVPEYVEKAGGE